MRAARRAARFVEFAEKILGSEFSTNVLFVRDCYVRLLSSPDCSRSWTIPRIAKRS
jgi:hypothetical protein